MQQTVIHLPQIHTLFSQYRAELDSLSEGIKAQNEQREILETFLGKLGLDINEQTLYAASQRLGNWKFEPLEIYAEKVGKAREEIDTLFELSYQLTREFVEQRQKEMLEQMKLQELLPDFYMKLLEGHHEIGTLFSELFLVWNRKLLFGVNRELEKQFDGDSDAILEFLDTNNLYDLGHHGERADRSYSILEYSGVAYIKKSYFEAFPEEITCIIAKIGELILELETLEDVVYGKKREYINYYQSIIEALSETDCDTLVERWSQVDVMWMAIDTPFQPAHMIEYYEDKYRKAVSIEWDFRIGNPDLFQSEVKRDIENMYEGLYEEIGREGEFSESYNFSKQSIDMVQLHLGVPFFSYGSFLCGMYSAQVVPNDSEVSKVYGKKIFAFPSFILQSYRAAPRMKLDSEMIHPDLLCKHYDFLAGGDDAFYKMYDIETIGHEYGHTLWLTPNTEVLMNQKTGLFKCIEEFKATAGGMVAYFFAGNEENREDILTECLIRNIKMMRYREVEDIVPYYCECLISLNAFYTSGIISLENGQIALHITDELYDGFKKIYIEQYTHLMHTYLHKLDAATFLHHYAQKMHNYYLPIEPELRDWVELYYKRYKAIGNEVESE